MQGSAWIFCLKLYYSYIFSRDEKYFSNNIYVCSTVYFLPTQTGLHSNCCVRSSLMEEILTKAGLSEPGSSLYPLSQLLRLLTSTAQPWIDFDISCKTSRNIHK